MVDILPLEHLGTAPECLVVEVVLVVHNISVVVVAAVVCAKCRQCCPNQVELH